MFFVWLTYDTISFVTWSKSVVVLMETKTREDPMTYNVLSVVMTIFVTTHCVDKKV